METTTMTTTLQHTTDQIQKFTTYTIDKLPSWMHLDPHIKSGYRPHLNSFRRCIASLFYLHNEFVNVWSHLVPGTLYAILLYKNRQALFGVEYCGDSRMGTLMVNLYIFTCTLCLLFSSAYHTFNAHSEHVSKKCLKLDYLGIIINTFGACVSSTWFGLRDHPSLQTIYISSNFAIAAIIFAILLSPDSDGPETAHRRSMLIVAFVASAYIPVLHAYLHSGKDALRLFPLPHTVGMELCFGIGTWFYLARFPERKYPGLFDIWGSSHQIFHAFAVFGQIIYMTGLEQLNLELRKQADYQCGSGL